MAIPEHLIYYRKKKGLTQRGLANLLGCNFTTVSHIEHGRRLPGKKLAMKIKFVTGVDCVCPTCGKYFDKEDSLDNIRPEPEVNIIT